MSDLEALLQDTRAELHAELEQECSQMRQEFKNLFRQVLQDPGNGLSKSSGRRTRGSKETSWKDGSAGMLQLLIKEFDRKFSAMEAGLIDRFNQRFDDVQAKAGLSALTVERSLSSEGPQSAMNTRSKSDEGDSRQRPAGLAAPTSSSCFQCTP